MLSTETKPIITRQEVRKGIQNIQEKLATMPGAMFGDCFPLKHSFAKGIYVREINVPKGMLVVTKIHKHPHPVFLLKGDVSVLEESGIKRVVAPCYFITEAGTKRVCYTHQDTQWITVHATEETDLEKIEDEVIAKTFDELPEDPKKLEEFILEAKQGELNER